MNRRLDLEGRVLDAESSVLAAAFAHRRERPECECRLCVAVGRYREALRAWGDEPGSRAVGQRAGGRKT